MKFRSEFRIISATSINDDRQQIRYEMQPAKLDHLVVNALLDLDMAQATFAALGFTVTPRGYHSLGSMNHLVVAGDAYLELVGIPGHGPQRQDVLDSPLGLSGLVLQSDDADATYALLLESGLPALEPLSFFRPITVDGREKQVGFRIVRMERRGFPAGRVYFCQHMTPELVWRPDWLNHPNGFHTIASVTVASPATAADADRYAALAAASAVPIRDGYSLDLSNSRIEIVTADRPALKTAALVFETLDRLDHFASALESVHWQRHAPDRATLRIPALRLELTCLGRPAGPSTD